MSEVSHVLEELHDRKPVLNRLKQSERRLEDDRKSHSIKEPPRMVSLFGERAGEEPSLLIGPTASRSGS